MSLIYVDLLAAHGWILRGKRIRSCHLFSYGPEAHLHRFAEKIGLSRAWFQDKASVPHYDLTSARRQRAIEAGAVEVGRRAAVEIWKCIRAQKQWEGEMSRREDAVGRIIASKNDNEKLAGLDADALLVAMAYREPIPMILFCPRCLVQHVDVPEPAIGWSNPPHRSHKCKACGCIWRPCDRPTTGVAVLLTVGELDESPIPLLPLRPASAGS